MRSLLALALLAGAAVNIYIVGLNQCEDVEIDRINKPKRPLTSGRMTIAPAAAKRGASTFEEAAPAEGR